jgi:prophage maintenance system killer protein
MRISRNHRLLVGNKRLAWGPLTKFCNFKLHQLGMPTEGAVMTMLAVAAPDLDGADFSQWLAVWINREC